MMAAAAICGAFAGCGGDKKAGGNAGGAQTVKFGFLGAYTGPAAAYGQAMKDGTELAVEEINNNPNTKMKIDLKTYDTKGVKAEAINAMKKCIEQDKVLAIEGPTLSGSMFAAGPIAQQSKVVAFGTGTTAPGITDLGDYIFRNAIPGKMAIPITVKKAHDKLGFKNVAIMYSNNNDQMVGEHGIYEELFKKMGIDVIDTETFADKDTDFSAQLTNIQTKNPDVIVVCSYYQEGSRILQKMREMGMNQPVLGDNGFVSPELGRMAGSAADNVYVSSMWSAERKDARVQNFVDAYTKKYGHAPDQFAASGYDGVYMAVDAMKRAGSTTDHKKIRDALAAMKDFKGVCGTFSFDDKRDPVVDLILMKMKDGKYSMVDM